MNARPGTPNSVFIGFGLLVVGLALALFAAMSALKTEHAARVKLEAERDSLRAVVKATHDSAVVDAFTHQNSSAQWNDALKKLLSAGLADPVESLRDDLVRHPELIPMPGTGGSHQLFMRDMVEVLNDRWVFAYFEDGHTGGEMLLEFAVKDGRIRWRVV